VRVSSLNELLSKLEKGGYITREPYEQDKRVMLVNLTEKGRNEQQPEPFDFGAIFSCLSGEEQDIFGAYLDRIIAALHASVGDDDEEMFEKMEALRERFGDMSEFFEEHGHEFLRGWGIMRGLRGSCHDQFRHGGFAEYGHSHGKNKDKKRK
jgi:DNA-binding MarR family transcriptional regulator